MRKLDKNVIDSVIQLGFPTNLDPSTLLTCCLSLKFYNLLTHLHSLPP